MVSMGSLNQILLVSFFIRLEYSLWCSDSLLPRPLFPFLVFLFLTSPSISSAVRGNSLSEVTVWKWSSRLHFLPELPGKKHSLAFQFLTLSLSSSIRPHSWAHQSVVCISPFYLVNFYPFKFTFLLVYLSFMSKSTSFK